MFIQFNRENRLELATLLRAGLSFRQCAKQLGFNHSAVSREVQSNKDDDGVYRAGIAHRKSLQRRKKAKQSLRKIENNKWLEKVIIKYLKLHWSPQQIAGRLKMERGKTFVCHETIYQWVYHKRPELKKYLRCKKGKYRKKRGTKEREKQRELEKFRHIEERPAIVESRERIGDWEGDTIIGKERKQRILTYNERRSGYLMADKLSVVTAEIVIKQTSKRFSRIPKHQRYTITYDRGREFGCDDDLIERGTRTKVYRANAYHSWERGSNENTNGLVREFFPKGTFFATITQKDVDRAVKLINSRPRKRLGYLTPHEVFKRGGAIQTRI